ncbi:MAG: hypothetical protein OYH76_22820 [Defluviicoccus sp.]|nr:hypothetical protein [Defluviicoccus sp.]MDE0278738.1 hypothetical protein [Defluviicoccus sp.]
MRKHLLTAFFTALDGLIAILFGVEAFAAATVMLGLVCAYAYRQEIRGWWAGRRTPVAAVSSPVEGEDQADITSDGKEVAKLILLAPDLEGAERIYTQYKRASHPEGRLFERFVHKAYRYRLDAAGERNRADEFYDVVESHDKDSVREDIEFASLVDEVETAANLEDTGKLRERRLRAASQNPGAGIHIAKLLSEARSLEEANEIWDIFKDAPVQTNKGSAYAAFAHALVRFDRSLAASEILREADMEGVSPEELEAAMNRFYYPDDEEESSGR